MLISHGTPLVGRNYRKITWTRAVRSLCQQWSLYAKHAPFHFIHLQRFLSLVVDWKPTIGTMPFQLQQGHCSSPLGRGTGKQNGVNWLFYLGLSRGCWTEPHSKHVVVGICQCFYLRMDSSLLWIGFLNGSEGLCFLYQCTKLCTLTWWPMICHVYKTGRVP